MSTNDSEYARPSTLLAVPLVLLLGVCWPMAAPVALTVGLLWLWQVLNRDGRGDRRLAGVRRDRDGLARLGPGGAPGSCVGRRLFGPWLGLLAPVSFVLGTPTGRCSG